LADFEGLLTRFRSLSPDLLKLARNGKRIMVVTHIDADGLCSGSLVLAALMRKGANVALRTLPELDRPAIESLASQGYDFYIFTDLASGLVPELEASLGARFLVLDHHQAPEEDLVKLSVVNAWAFGYDGGREACSSSVAYFFASALDPANRDLSPLAVVGSLADRQDSGPGRSLTGLNREAVMEAQAAGLLTVSPDLMFSGRETRPIHEAIALTSTPYLKGISGSKDAALALLHQSGIRLKEEGAWRTISSLSPEEKKQLTELIAGVVGGSEGATEAIAGLVGEAYTLEYEDAYTPLRDAREFGTLLNSCGRMGESGIGVSVCLGDRTDSLAQAMKTLSDYRSGLNKALTAISAEPSKLVPRGVLVLVRGEGVVDERLLGPVLSILTSSSDLRDKVVVGSSLSGDSSLKISCRLGDSYAGSVNLGLLMREAALAVGGVGGGHDRAAGAKVPISRSEEFFNSVVERVKS